MQLNRLVDDVLSEPAIELLNALAAQAIVSGQQASSLFFFPVEPDAWNSTMLLVREIFEAEILELISSIGGYAKGVWADAVQGAAPQHRAIPVQAT